MQTLEKLIGNSFKKYTIQINSVVSFQNLRRLEIPHHYIEGEIADIYMILVQKK